MALRELVAFLGYKVEKGSEDQVKRSIAGIKKLAVGLGAAFAAGALYKSLKGAVNEIQTLGDEIDKTSQRLGVNAQALQEIRFAAGLAGASARDVNVGLKALAKTANEAAEGSKSFVDDFKKLGVTVKDSNGQLKPTEQLLLEVGEGLRKVESDSERLAISQAVLGRAGERLIPLFTQGTEAIEAQRKEARNLGGVLEKDTIGAAVELTDDYSRLDFLMRGFAITVASEVIPAVSTLIRAFTALGAEFKSDIRKGAEVLGTSFGLMAKAIAVLIRNLPKLIPLIATLLIMFAPMTVAVFGISAAILLLIDDLEKMGEGSTSVTGSVIGEFKLMEKETGSSIKAIGGLLWNAAIFWGRWINENLTLSSEQIDVVKENAERLVAILMRPTVEFFNWIRKAFNFVIKALGRGGMLDQALGLADAPVGAGARGSVGVGVPAGQLASSSVVSSPTTNITFNMEASANNTDFVRKAAREIKTVQQDVNRTSLKDLTP